MAETVPNERNRSFEVNPDHVIIELSTNKMVLDRSTLHRKTTFNFLTPANWRVGDGIAMQINRSPYYVRWVNRKFVIGLPPEPPHGWAKEFYTLYNARTKDRVTIDFDCVEGFDKL